MGELWTCVAGILCGAGSALLFLGWQVWFASNGSTCDTRTMGKAFVGAPVVALLILLMGFPIGTVSSAVALWASAFILETSFAKTSPSNGGIRDLDMPWKNTSTLTLARELASPLGALLIFALVFGIGGQISFNSIDSAASFLLTNVVGIGGVLVAGLIFMAFGHIVGGKTHSEEIYRWVAPVVITAVAALPFAGPWYGILLNAVIVVSYYLMNYNYLCFIARGAHAGEWEPTVVASASQAAIRLTMLVGIIGGSTFLANWEASSLAKSAILALAVVYLLSMGLFRSRSKLNNPHDVTANVPRHTVEPVAPPTEPSMASLCTLYLLTDREGEVLAHLVNGYSVKLIAEELGVSPNTVRTHIRSLYDKMDIHNKDDLVRFYRSYVKINERATTI